MKYYKNALYCAQKVLLPCLQIQQIYYNANANVISGKNIKQLRF